MVQKFQKKYITHESVKIQWNRLCKLCYSVGVSGMHDSIQMCDVGNPAILFRDTCALRDQKSFVYRFVLNITESMTIGLD